MYEKYPSVFSCNLDHCERARIANADPLSTGEASYVLRICERELRQHVDDNTLRGFKMPPSRHRFIPRISIIRFAQENNLELPDWFTPTRVHLGKASSGSADISCATSFEVGMAMQTHVVPEIIIESTSITAMKDTIENQIRSTCERHHYPLPKITFTNNHEDLPAQEPTPKMQ